MAKAKPKKPTDETPVLHCIVENGRLVPAFPFDAERLASYRNGTKVYVWMSTDNGSRRLVRKWWAVIGWYIKNTETPWDDAESASSAIKLALNMIVPFKTAKGIWSFYPRSLNDIDDSALEKHIFAMEDLLTNMTGVDQETARRNGNSEGDGFPDEEPPVEESQQPDSTASAPPAQPSDAAAAAPVHHDQGSGGGEQSEEASQKKIDHDWLVSTAKQLLSAAAPNEQDLVNRVGNAIAAEIPARVSTDARREAKGIRDLCKLVCFSERKKADAVAEIATLLNVPKELIDQPDVERIKK